MQTNTNIYRLVTTTVFLLFGSIGTEGFAPNLSSGTRSHSTKRWGETITTESGLQYEDVVVGDGSSPGPNDFISVHYNAYLPNGRVFDSSRPKSPEDDKRSSLQQGEPLQFPLGRGKVIAGWEEGVKDMRVGGKRKLMIPSELAYGSTGTPDGVVKPGDNLKFDVELVAINGNMNLTGALGKSFLGAIGIILVNGAVAAITGTELREYLYAAINGN